MKLDNLQHVIESLDIYKSMSNGGRAKYEQKLLRNYQKGIKDQPGPKSLEDVALTSDNWPLIEKALVRTRSFTWLGFFFTFFWAAHKGYPFFWVFAVVIFGFPLLFVAQEPSTYQAADDLSSQGAIVANAIFGFFGRSTIMTWQARGLVSRHVSPPFTKPLPPLALLYMQGFPPWVRVIVTFVIVTALLAFQPESNDEYGGGALANYEQINLGNLESVNFSERLSGTVRYWDDLYSTILDASVYVASERREGCTEFSNCAYVIDGRMTLNIEETGVFALASSAYYDQDNFYLGSVDSDGVRCTAVETFRLPQFAAIGESGRLGTERCSDGNHVEDSFWSVTNYQGELAELTVSQSMTYGTQITSILINPDGELLGIKVVASGIDDSGFNFYISVSNY